MLLCQPYSKIRSLYALSCCQIPSRDPHPHMNTIIFRPQRSEFRSNQKALQRIIVQDTNTYSCHTRGRFIKVPLLHILFNNQRFHGPRVVQDVISAVGMMHIAHIKILQTLSCAKLVIEVSPRVGVSLKISKIKINKLKITYPFTALGNFGRVFGGTCIQL